MTWENVTENQRSPYRAMRVWRFQRGMDVSCDDCGWIQTDQPTLEDAKKTFREHRRQIH